MNDLEKFFTLTYKVGVAEERIDDLVILACGADPNAPDTWPFHDISYDPYDHSFELSGTTVGWEPPDLKEFWDIGFDRCWIRYTNGMERFAWAREPTQLGQERPSSNHHHARDDGTIVKIKATQQTLMQCRHALNTWLDDRGHDRCWYHPTLLSKLCEILSVAGPVNIPDLSRTEFEAGCRRFQDELYSHRLGENAHE